MAKGQSRREEATRWLAVRARDGLTFKELSTRSGIPLATLALWSSRLKKEGGSEAAQAGFVELAASRSVAMEQLGCVAMTVRFANGHCLELYLDTPREQLDQVLAFVSKPC